jgi:transposase
MKTLLNWAIFSLSKNKKKGFSYMKFISNNLWCELEKIIPQKMSKVGRPEVDNRQVLEGIIYVLYTGIQWKVLPEKYGYPTTVHGKFMKWCRMKVFSKMMIKARSHYQRRNSKNNWYAFDTILKKAPFAQFGGKNPTDRAKHGIKQGILVDRKGAPLYVYITSANAHDSGALKPVIDQMRKSKNIRIVASDSAFDAKKLYSLCKEKNIALVANINPRRNKNVHVFHVPYRWVVERTFGILSWFRGLKSCWSKTIESAYAFLELACSYRLFKMAGIFG